MKSKYGEKYLEALKTFNDYITIDEWIERIIELYPEELIEAEKIKSNEKRTPIGKLKKVLPTRIKNKTCKAAIKKDESTNKYKYIPEDQRPEELDSNTEKYIELDSMLDKLESIKYLDNSYSRDDEKYIGNSKLKGIEQINAYEFNSYLMFEMAIRNDDVIKILDKLNFLEKLKDEYPYLESIDCIIAKPINNNFECDNTELKIIDADEKDFPQLSTDLEKTYKYICELPLLEFKNELNFLIDNIYSDNFNKNHLEDMENDNIDIFEITDEEIKKYKFKNTKGKTYIDEYALSFHKILIIENYLQDKLKFEYFIFPNGYPAIDNETCNDKIIDKDSGKEFIKKLNSTKDDSAINNIIIEFRKLKPTEMGKIADFFFIYDYNKKQVSERKKFTFEEIKYKLTVFHYINIKKGDLKSEKSYKECRDRYDELKNFEAGFYIGEKAIDTKLKLMQDFIDYKYYQYLIFN